MIYNYQYNNQKLFIDLQERGETFIPTAESVTSAKNMGNYYHSEQAFISDLQNNQKSIATEEYDRFLLLLVNTHSPCTICGQMLSRWIDTDRKRNELIKLLQNFPHKMPVEKLTQSAIIQEILPTKSINIFFESLSPEVVKR